MEINMSELLIKGEISNYPAEKSTECRLVTYWNLVRSYIIQNYPDKIVCFVAKDLATSTDFLHYATINVFETENDLKDFYEKSKQDKDRSDKIVIYSVNGKITG